MGGLLVAKLLKDTQCHHIDVYSSDNVSCTPGRVLQMPGSCAMCSRPLTSTDLESYPVSYTLMEVLELLRDRLVKTAPEMEDFKRNEVTTLAQASPVQVS